MNSKWAGWLQLAGGAAALVFQIIAGIQDLHMVEPTHAIIGAAVAANGLHHLTK